MALVIENTIDLTAYEDNPAPKRVEQLSIIHEAVDGELVQYYIDPENETEGDKNTYAIGIYHKDTRSYTYNDYDELVWNEPDERICGNRIERLGVKAFPDVGAIAFYRLKHRNITRIVAPVNPKNKKNTAPTLSAVINSDGTVTFTIVPPEKPQYACYRIVMQYDIYEEDHITYDLEITCPAPRISGTYKCFAIGYGKEGQLLSRDSNVLTLNLTGRETIFTKPYYTRSEVQSLAELAANLDERVRALEEHPAVIDPLTVTSNGVYTPPESVTGFAPVTVHVSGGSAVIEPLTITENGTYEPPLGIDGFAPVVARFTNKLADFNFRDSLVDSVSGFVAELQGSNIHRDENGVHITGNRSGLKVITGNLMTSPGTTVVMDIEEYIPGESDSYHRRAFMTNNSCGIIFRNTGSWQVYYGSWYSFVLADPSFDLTDKDFFSGHKLSIYYNPIQKKITWYMDRTEIGSVTISNISDSNFTNFTIGNTDTASAGGQFYNTTVSGVRIYQGLYLEE